MSFAVKKIDEPMIPLTSRSTESSSPNPRTRVGLPSGVFAGLLSTAVKTGVGSIYPIPSSSGDSRGVPQRLQITAEQSPQIKGSFTSCAQFGQ